MPGVSAAIIDVEGIEFKPVGEDGELILHGPNIMQGYWKRPEANAESFVEIDGKQWLRTGDLVRMDEEGYFYFFDRKRDLIKYKGYSVFARHVEEVLYKHPQIKAAGVVGCAGSYCGAATLKPMWFCRAKRAVKFPKKKSLNFARRILPITRFPKLLNFEVNCRKPM